jgi:hypothetical protein
MIIKTPDILIPKKEYDLTKWAVVACDQFTSEKDYWENLDNICGDISALRIIYPEVYLNEDEENRIKTINAKMSEYLEKGIFREIKGSYILVERITGYNHKRLGLMISIDVEQYDYTPLTAAPIKATERTVEERLPVRIRIREDAPLETPHVMLLMDDVNKEIIEPLYAMRDSLELLYDFELNSGGGHVRGYRVTDTEDVNSKLMRLIDKDVLNEKYGVSDNPFLFAVGDGNHSLATAKACWERIKHSVDDPENHPARYALAELVNLYDDDLLFEPIHRVMFNVDKSFIDELRQVSSGPDKAYIVYEGERYDFSIPSVKPEAIAVIQDFLDKYLSEHKGAEIDYVHGEEHTVKVADKAKGAAIIMPTIEKSELFKFVLTKGVLCRKAFSMGEAEEKRYYLECKKIKG